MKCRSMKCCKEKRWLLLDWRLTLERAMSGRKEPLPQVDERAATMARRLTARAGAGRHRFERSTGATSLRSARDLHRGAVVELGVFAWRGAPLGNAIFFLPNTRQANQRGAWSTRAIDEGSKKRDPTERLWAVHTHIYVTLYVGTRAIDGAGHAQVCGQGCSPSGAASTVVLVERCSASLSASRLRLLMKLHIALHIVHLS